MRKSFVVLMTSLAAVTFTGSLAGCVVAPAEPVYGYDYYQPGYAYYPYPAYAEPSVGVGIGFWGGGGGWHDHDRGHWREGGGWHGGHGGWRH